MTIYLLLLVMARFHNDPRVGMTLFDAGVLLVTPVKVVGLFAVLAPLVVPRPKDAAPRSSSSMGVLFLAFAAVPLIEAVAFRLPTPGQSISSLLSLGCMLIATRSLIVTQERMLKAIRTLTLASAVACLWTFKQYFLQHFDRPPGLEQDPNYEALTLVAGLPLAAWLALAER